jgi:hypothetical protein
MNSRIELLMAIAGLQEDIRTVSDARAAKADDAHVVTQPGVVSRRNAAEVRCVDGVPVSLALGRRGSSSRALIQLAGAGDDRCSGERGQV